jgi:DNA polymerase epsilon subunit 2
MRKIEERVVGPEMVLSGSRRKIVILSEVVLDQPSTLSALRKVLAVYNTSERLPSSIVLMGNFSGKAAVAGAGTGSIEYKELFNDLASVLADFPLLLRSCTWVFVPGDNDPWPSAFSAGGSTLIPREGVPDLFTSRIKRVFATAKADAGLPKKDDIPGEAIWTSNPSRLSLFGPAHEIVLFRDDVSSRFRRNAVRIGQAAGISDEAEPGPDDEDVEMVGALPSIEHQDTQPMVEDNTDMPLLTVPVETTTSTASTKTTTPATLRAAKRLVLSLLPQSTLSPFPLAVRPTHWDYSTSGALSLYPLPHTLVLADPSTPAFALTYEGCHVVNPGRLVVGGSGGGRRKLAGWLEYDIGSKRAICKEIAFVG